MLMREMPTRYAGLRMPRKLTLRDFTLKADLSARLARALG